MSESLALPSAGSQLLRHPQPHTRTCAHAHAHGAVTRARSHARPPCPSSPSPPRLQAAIRALHCGSCLQVGGASAPPHPPHSPSALARWVARSRDAAALCARAAPSLGAPGPGPQKGPAGRSSPPAFQAGAVLKQEWARRRGQSVGAPSAPGPSRAEGGAGGASAFSTLGTHARGQRCQSPRPHCGTRHHFPRAAGGANGGRVCQQSPRSSRSTGSEEAWGLPGPGGRGAGAATCQPALPDPKLPAPCAPAAATGEDPEAGALDRGCWERKTAPPPRATGWIKPERGAPLRPHSWKPWGAGAGSLHAGWQPAAGSRSVHSR